MKSERQYPAAKNENISQLISGVINGEIIRNLYNRQRRRNGVALWRKISQWRRQPAVALYRHQCWRRMAAAQ